MNLLSQINQRQREEQRNQQEFLHGVIVSYRDQNYVVNAMGLSFYAESLTSDRFLVGDRVFMVLGQGTPRILGLQGKDENSI